MLRVNYLTTYGVVKVKSADGKRTFDVKIHPANALCAFIYHYKDENGVYHYKDENGDKYAQLWMFLADKQHIKNIMKNSGDHTLLGTSVVSVKLNVYYKEARTLIEPMCKSGYKVTCYYKEPKKK